MIRRLVLLFGLSFLFLAGSLASAQGTLLEPVTDLESANERLEKAHLAFERGDTREAMELYVRVAQSGFVTPAVWSNAGTAAYRSGDRGRAVLYYKRALRLDPNYERARKSLEVISPATNQGDEGFQTQFIESVFETTSPSVWILFAEFFYILLWFAVARIVTTEDRDQRGHWGAILGWCLGLALLTGGVAWANHSYRAGSADAVVLENQTITRSEPNADSQAQLELPAGTVLELTESPQRGFVRFKMADGRTGYIPMDRVERI